MSAAHMTLPQGFAALEPFVADWAVEGSAARAALRGSSRADARAAFYAAGRDLLRPALDHLDARGFAGMDEADGRLMNLMLSLAHVSLAVEMQGEAEEGHARMREFMRVTRTPAGA